MQIGYSQALPLHDTASGKQQHLLLVEDILKPRHNLQAWELGISRYRAGVYFNLHVKLCSCTHRLVYRHTIFIKASSPEVRSVVQKVDADNHDLK